MKMAIRIHHATAKKAKKYGITLEVIENEVVASFNGRSIMSAPSADRALAATIGKLESAEAVRLVNGPKALWDTPVVEEVKSSSKRKAKPIVEEDESEDAEDGDEEDEPEDESRSVVKSKYRKLYRPTRNTCGDDLARLISGYVSVGKGKLRKTDEAKLMAFAKRNGVWHPDYANINVGLRRMSIGNRLRRKVNKEKHEIIW